MSRPPAPKEPQRIAKLLARAGVASRREIERMIADGRVAIDGKALDTPATLVPSLRGVTVDGVAIEAPRPARLFVFHKPVGLLVTERDPKGRPTIYDRLPNDLPRVVPVGRLDLNTEGLLLLTTDGELKRQLELPATGVERTYRARAYGAIGQDQLESLIDGIEIDGVRYGAIDANLERRTGANVWIELTLTEGKNREVRRVLEHLGLRVSRLIRTRYGPFVLGDLPPGAIGEVRQHDLVAFRQALAKGRMSDTAIAVVPYAQPQRSTPPLRSEPEGRAKRNPVPPAVRPERVEGRVKRAPTPSVRPEPVEGRVKGKTGATRNRPSTGSGRTEAADNASAKRASAKRRPGWAKPKPRPRPGGRRK
ncbi:MAG TPA: pseudouridine synthase [Sphingomonas sp.]|nr:pseudouridine synthase [Sphingomonas sp.]